MGFIDFLGGAVKILAGGAVFLLAMYVAGILIIQGETLLGLVILVIGFVGGLYAQYQRGQQPQRMR